MNNNQFSKNAISHKDLKALLIKAKKDSPLNDIFENNKIKEEEVFNDLVKNWTETSQKILLMMNQKEKNFIENRNPKSLIAFGAMGVHIHMALQALKSTESEH